MYSVVKCPYIFIFILLFLMFSWFLILFIYIIYIRQQEVLFITQEKLGKSYSAVSSFKCQGVHCSFTYFLLSQPVVRLLLGTRQNVNSTNLFYISKILNRIKCKNFANVFLYLIRKDSQTFKGSSCKTIFLQCACYWYNFNEYFRFHGKTRRHCFL